MIYAIVIATAGRVRSPSGLHLPAPTVSHSGSNPTRTAFALAGRATPPKAAAKPFWFQPTPDDRRSY
jgi:hypothetical protein